MYNNFCQTAAPEREEQTSAHMHTCTELSAAAVSGFQCKRASFSLICLFDAVQCLQHSASQLHFSTGEVTAEDDERRSEGSKFGFFSPLPSVLGGWIHFSFTHLLLTQGETSVCYMNALRHALSLHTHTYTPANG